MTTKPQTHKILKEVLSLLLHYILFVSNLRMEEILKNSKSSSSSSSAVLSVEDVNKKIEELVATLPLEMTTRDGSPLYQFKGCWVPDKFIRGMIVADLHFQAQDSDIILASLPKSGTTWLKALIFSIVNRKRYAPSESPLLTTHPHHLIKNLEMVHYSNGDLPENLHQLPEPRLFSTHSHYGSLPHLIIHSRCRIVYICRNPLDSLVSLWYFLRLLRRNHQDMEATYQKYCCGISIFGPFWDSILGYWHASLQKPEKVLFVMYEDLKEDTVFEVKRLAKFLGFPFSFEEEKEGFVEEILRLCSFENLKNLEVNQVDEPYREEGAPSYSFFRKGQVGDYVNHFNPSMVENLVKLTKEKLAGSGLVFKYSVQNK